MATSRPSRTGRRPTGGAHAQLGADVPEHLPSEIDADVVYVCTVEPRAVPGDGTWLFAVVDRATAGADAMLDAYAIPYAGLITEVVAEARLHQLSSGLADRVGCEDITGDLLAYGQMVEPEYPERDLGDLVLGVDRACTYAVEAPPPGDKVAGTLVTAELLDAADKAAIEAALADSVEDPGCARIGHTQFVVLRSDATQGQVFIALDGCAVQLDGTWWRATDEQRALLGG